jgi:hypothetical protein
MPEILEAVIGKRAQSRTMILDAPNSEILDVLSSYGILEDMLLTEMGVTVQYKQSEWPAKRIAAEMEVI